MKAEEQTTARQGEEVANGGQHEPGRVPVALTIAGFDPSSGAGVTADLKTFAAHGVYGVACITALTVQSTLGVRAVEPVRAELVRKTLDCLAEDMPFAGVKIGMLGTLSVASEVHSFLERAGTPRSCIVLDPVICSSSGKRLLDDGGVAFLRDRMLGILGWITPNRDELGVLTGLAIPGRAEVPAAAQRLQEMAAAQGNPKLNVVVTGGDLERPDDFLLPGEGAFCNANSGEAGKWISGELVKTAATHGTGCAFSAALVAELIAGFTATGAVANAKAFVTVALRSAYPVGQGHGPMHHLFRLQK